MNKLKVLTGTVPMSYEDFWRPLTQVYEPGEAKAIAQLVFEQRYHLSLADLLLGRTGDEAELRHIQQRLLQGEPVQYVLGLAEFGPYRFHVAPGVLIPRPETYELCQWIVTEHTGEQAPRVLDIGTGSGCIACTLAAELPQAQVRAWDISPEALAIASENAQLNHVNVVFEQRDALHPPGDEDLWDIIVSNPPYIINKERAMMEKNVLDYEPHQALFVPDDNPLLFYRAIAQYGQQALKAGGQLYFEMNPLYAAPLADLLGTMLYHDIEMRLDQFNKQRMIRAKR